MTARVIPLQPDDSKALLAERVAIAIAAMRVSSHDEVTAMLAQRGVVVHRNYISKLLNGRLTASPRLDFVQGMAAIAGPALSRSVCTNALSWFNGEAPVAPTTEPDSSIPGTLNSTGELAEIIPFPLERVA